MIRRTYVVCLLAVAMLLPLAARAEHTRYWRQTDFAEFQKGTAKGVAVRSDGKLRPALKFDSFADPNLAYLWALRLNSKGQLYAAGGSDAKVLRFDDAGKPTTVFESAELAAQAIAFDSADNLYVGTSPDGKVYQVTPDGKKTVFFEPKTKYIWALTVDPQGTLYVATGDTGEVFAVTPEGKGQLFYQSRERHARSLALDSKGHLLIGTEPDGLVVRVEIAPKAPKAAPEAGASFVIYETNKAEVTSLVTDPDGNIYAASIGEKNRVPATPLRVPPASVTPPTTVSTVTGGGTVIAQAQPGAGQTNIVFPFPAIATGGGAEVVRIAPDGSPQTLWTSRDDLVLSMGLSPTGKLLLGTGDNGTLVELEGDDVYSSLASTASEQVTSLVAGLAGKVFVATANPGKIFTLGPGSEPNGSFESEPFDAKIFSRWGHLTWWGDNGATDGKVAFYVRSGNTSTPEDNWSAWSGPYKSASGEAITCPPARFVQWRAVFVDTNQGLAPSISWVSLAYQPKNVAPVVDDVVIEDPGVRAAGFPMQPAGGAPPAQLRYPRAPGSAAAMQVSSPDSGGNSKNNEPPPQGAQQKGYQSVLWSAHDDNDDDLIFTIYFRAESEKDWRVLKDKLTQHYYSWDTSSMPDGAYYLKIVARDSPSNPEDQALWGARESDRWTVANTPPRIENLRAGSGLLNTKASFDAYAASSTIARAEYSIDAGDWQLIFPTDVLSDAPKESYFMQLPGYLPGEHTLAVQVTDDFGNTTTAKTNFTVQPRNTGK
jgi:sugar lactone lactonase YvrE